MTEEVKMPIVAYGWENTRPGSSGLMQVELWPGQYPDVPTRLVRECDAVAYADAKARAAIAKAGGES